MSRGRQSLGIEHAILGLLRERPLHGYDVYRRLVAPGALGSVWPLKQSQFYALVTRLEAEGYLSVTPEPRGDRPPRKLLQLTSAGAAAFAGWLHAPLAYNAGVPRSDEPADEREQAFLARLYFARQAGAAAVEPLLAAQRRQLRARLHALRRDAQATGAPHSYPWLVSRWQIGQAEAMLDWLDSFGPPPPAPAITYRIAAVADSPVGALARQFVAFACGPEGQALLARAGFLPAGEALAAASSQAPLAGCLVVYAASSLTAAFEALAAAFTAAHPAVRVEFAFGGSQTLANALAQGARADVYAPAHADALAAAVAAGRVTADAVHTLGHNQLAIVTPARRPTPLRALSDLARPGLRLALGSGATAIGRYAQEALSAAEQQGALGSAGMAAVLHNVVHYAETVTGVLDKVAHGEVDAGIVFTSDYHRAGGEVQVTAVPPLR